MLIMMDRKQHRPWIRGGAFLSWNWGASRKVLGGTFMALSVGAAVVIAGMQISAATEQHSAQETRFWNGQTRVIDRAGQAVSESTFHAKWVNYLDETNSWQHIDTDFSRSEDKPCFEMTQAPFEVCAPLRSTGIATMLNNNRWDVFSKKVMHEAPLTMSIMALEVHDVAGEVRRGDLIVPTGVQKNVSYVIYPHAYPEGDLIYYVDFGRAPRLEKLVRINSVPTKMQYKFEITYDSDVQFRGDKNGAWNASPRAERGKGLSVKKQDGALRGIGFKTFQIWDSNTSWLTDGSARLIEPVDVTIVPHGRNSYVLTKDVTRFFEDMSPVYPVYTDTTSTFYPDAHTETTTVDGRVARVNEATWSDAHDASAGDFANDDHTNNALFSQNNGSGYSISRHFLLFDTSAIPNADVISDATLSFVGYGGGLTNTDNDGQDYVVVVSSNPASNTALGTDDYDQAGTTAYSSTVDFGSLVANDSTYNDLSFNATGKSNIDKNGVSKFALREGHDMENASIASNSSNSIEHYWADQTGTSQDPKLVVVHAANPPAAVSDLSVTDVSATTVELTLTAPGADGSVGTSTAYDLRYSTSNITEGNWDSATQAAGEPTPQVAGSTETITVSGLAPNTLYYFAMKASDEVFSTSTLSNVVSTTTTSFTSPANFAVKTSDQSRSSTTTAAVDSQLVLTDLATSTTYIIEGEIFASTTSGTPDLKIVFSVPSGAQMDIGYIAGSATTFRRGEWMGVSNADSQRIAVATTEPTVIHIKGTVTIGNSIPGDLKLKWAQFASSASPTTIMKGSYLRAEPVE
jgi:hypothetical protein